MRIYRQSTFFIEHDGYLIKKYKVNTTSHFHKHDFVEIVFVCKGHGIHTINDISYSMIRGSFFIVDSGEQHQLKLDCETEYYNLFLTVPFLKQMYIMYEGVAQNAYDLFCTNGEYTYVPFDAEKSAQMEMIFQMIYQEYASKSSLSNDIIKTYIQLIIYEAIQYHLEVKNNNNSHAPYALPRVIDYINQHYLDNLNINELASKYKYNAAYFGRLFAHNYNMSILDYIAIKRIDYIKNLLITTDYTITNIYSQSGFNNKLQFYSRFKELVGCTPNEYRKQENIIDNTQAVN